jgi:hypothetical protein
MSENQIQVSSNGATIWVHASDGSTVGRFSKIFGMDIHTTIAQQLNGADQCLHCTHVKPTEADWYAFCASVLEHYGIDVDKSLIKF